MYKLSILVLLYNKEVVESETLNSLSRVLKKNDKDINLVIWNNGPNHINNIDTEEVFGDVKVTINETIYNESLSVIYNRFISEYPSIKYIILDHDTYLNGEYLESAINSEKDISLPIISSNNRVVYPKVEDAMCSKKSVGSCYFGRVTTIASGLVVSNNIAEILKDKFGNVFDERFFFYGVDSSFFYRLELIDQNVSKLILPGVEHSLSKNEIESAVVTKFRIFERSIDIALTVRYYSSSISLLRTLFRVFYYSRLNFMNVKTLYSLKVFTKYLLVGKHERNR